MKDYTLNSEEQKTFILNYSIIRNNIVMWLANGEKCVIPYSEKSELEVLERMERQVYQATEKENQLQLKIRIGKLLIGLLLFGVGGIYFFASSLVVGKVLLFLSILSEICLLKKNKDYKEIIADIEASRYFLAHKKELEIGIKNIHPDLLNLDSKIANDNVWNEEEIENQININTIDGYSLEDLQKIRDNLETVMAFQQKGISISIEEESEKVLSKK